MNKPIKNVAMVVLVGGAIIVAVWASWWWLRATTAVDVFGHVRVYARDSLGLSDSVAAAIATGLALFSAYAITMLRIKPWYLIAAGGVAIAGGIPIALYLNSLASPICFDRADDKALCSLWLDTYKHYHIRRDDSAEPPSSWVREGEATHLDVETYLLDMGPQEPYVAVDARVPRRVQVESCTDDVVFWDGRGVAVVFYSRRGDSIIVWDRAGYDSTTRDVILPVTPAIVAEFCKALATAKAARVAADLEEAQKAEAAQHLREQLDAAATQRAQDEANLQRDDEIQRQRDEEAQQAAAAAQARQEEDARVTREKEQAADEAAQRAAAAAQLANSVSQPAPPEAPRMGSLSVRNSGCFPATIYDNGRIAVTVPPGMTYQLSVTAGDHQLVACPAGSGNCAPSRDMSTSNGPYTLNVYAATGCGGPPAGYLVGIPAFGGMGMGRQMPAPSRVGYPMYRGRR